MEKSEKIKAMVQERYSRIAEENVTVEKSCCGSDPNGNKIYNIMMDKYDHLEGYHAEADLGLGCGLPTAFAKIQPGMTVVDLGSGAGNDCFVARHEVGTAGKVIGIDFSEAMISKARRNADTLGYNNVEFRFGDIENAPVGDAVADVVVSNCVLNLVPDKQKVVSEIFRILKPGGHFSISDIVLVGSLPDALRSDAEMYAGCVAGAIQKDDYLSIVKEAGFESLEIQKEKPISLPESLLKKYLNDHEMSDFAASKTGIFSITLFGQKPGKAQESETKEKESCCGPGCCQ